MTSARIPHFDFTAQDEPHDFHAASTITLDELVDAGFVDWDAPEWQWDAYDDAQRARMNEKIVARYGIREIGLLPWAAWRRQFIRKLDEVMPKYKALYKKLEEGFDLMRTGDDYGKHRAVNSDFPASLLNSENQDYAKVAEDREYENVRTGDDLDKYVDFANRYNDVDVLVLDELEPLFSSLIAVNFNGF